MAEYLARVSWETVLRYKELWRKDISQLHRPVPLTNQYGSNQPKLGKLCFGDGLWLFVAPEFGKGAQRRILPPTILGRIEITQRTNQYGFVVLAHNAPKVAELAPQIEQIEVSNGYRFWRGGMPSVSLPIHNAFAVFKTLTFVGTKTQLDPGCPGCNSTRVPKQGPYGHLMLHFQSIRQLTCTSVRQLSDLQAKLKAKKTVFLSHCHGSAGELVCEVAAILEPVALCWWDIQVMPQRRWYDDDVLQNMLSDGIRQAAVFVAFVTPDYLSSTWCQTELTEAKKAGGPKIIQVRLDGSDSQLPTELMTNTKGWDAREIAEAIIRNL